MGLIQVSDHIFFNYGYFSTLGTRTESDWGDVFQKHQRTVDNCSILLRVTTGYIHPEKVSWYTI